MTSVPTPKNTLLIACLCAALSAPVAAETRAGYGGNLVGSVLSEPVELDPARAQAHAELTLASLIFDTLYQIDGVDPSGEPRVLPLIAEALPEFSEDGVHARIRVRAGIAFHDGNRLDAGDVAASLERVLGGPSSYLMASVRAIERRDEEVILTLSRPTPELAVLLAAAATAITPDGRAPTWQRPVGSGPFKLVRVDRPKRQLELLANNLYFAGRPYINKLTLRWFERGDDETEEYEVGESHLSLRGAVAYPGHTPKYVTGEASGPATLLVYVGFGHTEAHRAIVGNRDFRRAVSLAMERDSLRAVGSGERIVATLNPMPATAGGPSPKAAERRARIREARAAVDAAARNVSELRARADGRRGAFELELIIDRTRPDDREIAEKVLAALFSLGIKARITGLDAPVFAERVGRGACDLYIGQLAMPTALAPWTLAAAFARAGDDALRAQLAAAPLDVERASRAFAERLPLIPLFHRAVRAHHRDNVRGLHFDSASRLSFGDLYFFGRAQRSR